MICPYCSHENPEGRKRCRACAKPLAPQTVFERSAPPPTSHSASPKTPLSKMALASLVLGFFSLIVSFGIAALLLGHMSRNRIAESGSRLPEQRFDTAEPVHLASLQEPFVPCVPSEKNTCGANMKLVLAAWTSPDALWEFLTSPETGAAERRVAASKAERIIPLDWLPEVLKARRELWKEQALHNFGLADYPFKDWSPFGGLKTPRDRIGTQTTRMILRHPFVVPEKWIAYPPKEDGVKRAWPAQVLAAMETLYSNLLQHSDPKEIDSIALKLPCTDYETARQIVDLTLDVARIQRFAPPEVFGAWLNIQKGNSDVNRASIGILGRLHTVVTKEDETWAMAQVLGLQALETQDISMTYPSIDAISMLHPTPYTFALGAARYLVSSKDSAYNRAYEADGLLRTLGEPLLGTPRFYEEKKQGQYAQEIGSFAEWLKKNEARLNERANTEKPLIESARKKMSVATACRR
jgi:hypothetical protein